MTIFQIEDSRPFLTHNGLPIQWHTGSAPWWGMTSSMIRINKRGVAFAPRSWHTRGDLRALPEWEYERCVPSALGLCSSQTSIAFPSQQTPIVDEALDWLCGSTATQRAVTNSMMNTNSFNASRYDHSACDVLDANADYVLADRTLFRSRSTELPEWVYWTVSALIVYLVRCLSRYVLASLSAKRGSTHSSGKAGQGGIDAPKSGKSEDLYPSPVLCVSACAAAALLVVGQGDFVYVAEEALLFYRFTLFYIASYAILFTGNRVVHLMHSMQGAGSACQCTDPPFYNLLAGVMQLVASRLYCGPETPYNPPLIFIIAVRMAVKSRRGSDTLRALTLLLDAFMVSLVCILGFSPHSRYLIALFCAAMAASDTLVD